MAASPTVLAVMRTVPFRACFSKNCTRALADGRRSLSSFPHSSVALLCDNNRMCGSPAKYVESFFVDAASGRTLPWPIMHDVVVDTSGALTWCSGGRDLVSAGAAQRNGTAVVCAPTLTEVYSFRYGVCLVRSANTCHVLRFDLNPHE